MPACTRCLAVKPIEAFSDAQLCSGKNKCLMCSNLRLHEQKRAEGLEQQPLSDLGRSCGARKPRLADEDSLHECSGCRKLLPRKQFSKRQLSQGHGRCHACAAKACAVNVAKQARKRPVDEMLDDDDDSDDERYKASLLRGVEEARRSSGSCSAGAASSSADLTLPIDASNPGHRMLQKLGWVPGEGLGLQGQGDLDPLALVSRQGRAGLGILGDTGEDHDEPASCSEPADSSTGALPASARPAGWLRWVEHS